MNQPLDTQLFDRAAKLAIEAHSGTERRSKATPYIIHPMEAAAIVATITNDPELLAAAVLHDVVEDTNVTIDTIRDEFGDRIASLVENETAPSSVKTDWRKKRQMQIETLAKANRDSKIVALGDKLSNLRAIAGDFRLLGDELWTRFHAPNGKTDIEWYYRGLAGALFELSETLPFQEFLTLLDQTFGPMDYSVAQRVEIEDYVESGGGFFATSYNHRDGQTMVKFYNADVDKSIPQTELSMAYAVSRMRIPTPMPGRFVTDGTRFGAEFRRISPKESFARYVSNRPESYEEIAHRFARMCRTLHSTSCDTTVFQSEKENVLNEIDRSPRFSADEKARIRDFVSQVPDIHTCLHGDMHIGNVITTALDPSAPASGLQQDFWIDMGDFRWGNPLFDLGMFYLTCNYNDEKLTQHLFHLDNATMRRIWNIFIRDYYSIESEEDQLAAEQRLKPFATFKLIRFDNISPLQEPIIDFLRSTLLATL